MAIAEELYPQEGSIAGAAPGGIPEVEERIARRIAFFEEHAPIEVEVPAAMGPAGRETYGWIDFGHLPNTRDLGGLAAAEGSRVKPKLLLRSGALGFGSDADLNRLRDEYHLGLVVDLRNVEELIEIPDPMDAFPGARYVHADILARSAEGITQEKATREKIARERREFERSMRDDTDDSMEVMYRYLLMSASGMLGYRALLRSIIEFPEGAALWHCSVGRDRCGLASALMETVLGVDWEDIEADYLATNIFATNEQSFSYPAVIRALRAARDAATERYGSLMGYINEALEVTPAEVELLRERYLA
ncbi:tyrosine-protein phosphatase [[Collinsella] massiliensis]|uniref:Protein tyrosine phosphatase n=1 Tax=[Collinsella] massiliensis TaxID=1232426 RepID=A0A1Y3XWF7_9ACTN|nr:tyrosine-protein phosphatase [[Collinsella] massiliensis]OUN88628.1 protein tyrosine phosphatase [[Collinsella] massiliensis]